MRVALVIGVALVLLACGGDGRQDAVKTAEAWLGAIGDRDADRACELMADSAVDKLRAQSGLGSKASCLGVVRAYSDGFATGDIESILKVGLEAEGAVSDDEVGVFPRSGPRELQVILMQRKGGEWKVAGMSLGPTEPTPTPSATPAQE